MKQTFKYLKALFYITVAVALLQTAYFLVIGIENNNIEKADLIAVFTGEKERITAGFQLAQQGYASNLTITGSNKNSFEYYFNKYGSLPSLIEPIISGKSSTTFEDALATKRILQKRKFKSVILVTSTYHLPRAYFLLKTLLLGTNVTIKRYGVNQKEVLGAGSKLTPEGSVIKVGINSKVCKAQKLEQKTQPLNLKTACNEMIKFWASLGEMTGYRVSGKLLADIPFCLRMKIFLKSKILFQI